MRWPAARALVLLRADPEDGRLDEVAELGLGGEEGFHLAPQLVVPLAGGVEESRPFGLFPIQGALQDDFDLLPALGCHHSPGTAWLLSHCPSS